MATKKQKQQLIEILKFQPTTARILIHGYGGEAYAGRVSREVYDFFKEHRIDLDEYAADWDGDFNRSIPAKYQPFVPGSPYECDDLFHASGAELSDLNELVVEDVTTNRELWRHNCGFGPLEESGVTVRQHGGADICDHVDKESVVFWGGSGEKGCFFDGEFTLRAPFDPKKLTIIYEDCDDWYIITDVCYDGEEIDGSGGYSTTGKWNENKWMLPGDEQVYKPGIAEVDDIDDPINLPVLDGEQMQAQTAIDFESDRSVWWNGDVRPQITGEYEVIEKGSTWPFPQRAAWTGRSWKSHGDKIVVKQWRGLNYDPYENAQPES